MEDDILGIIVGVALLVATVFLVIAAGTVVFFAAIPAGIGYTFYWFKVHSPDAQERRAKERTHALYNEVRRRFTSFDVPAYFLKNLNDDDEHTKDILFRIASQLVAFEGLEDYPPAPPINCDTIEGGRYRDFLNAVSPDDYRARIEHIASVANLCALPPTNENIATILLAAVSEGAPTILLPKTAQKIDENFLALKSVTPQNYAGDNIIWDYFKGTPLTLMSDIFHDDSVSIPDALRTQHQIIVAGSGHGKTQCLQEMILKDLDDDDACVIVMDSQQEMLEKLLHVVPWDRCMYLDGGNLHHPLGLGAFEIGSTLKIEDEPKLRTAVALYEHMFSSRETKLTTKQSTLYRYLSRFLMVIPGANFDTALQILEHGYDGFEAHIAKLDTTSQTFIQSNLDNPKAKGTSQAYKQTRQEVAQRVYTLLESRAISQMFNAPVSKVNIGKAIKDNRIILINTAQSVLGDEGASLFGRYCLAQIAMEVLSRTPTKRRVYFYIDEAQEYLSGDPVIHRLFEQGRKRGLCMICAFHRLGQVPELEDMLKTLTSIKLAGGISASDAGKLAKELDTDAETIRAQPELSFWAWFRGHGNGVYRVTPGVLESIIDREPDDPDTLKSMMIDEYHYTPARSPDNVRDQPDDFDASTDNDPPPDPEPDFEGRWGDIDPDAPQKLD
ncbi:hypothetical protein [uncultured Roseobacter sp.]|uniref:hypothetical protein n=1 Tax=uncultured Roseobacter sp. TaxID=114847 RepID=UPI0026101A4B|nr:hypothetical protein [uncultured Roseobacter sp.]